MAGEIVTKQELIDAKVDAKDLGEAMNERVIVKPRYGDSFKSLPLLTDEAQGKINSWQQAIDTITVNDGVPALAVSDASGKTQQEINDRTVNLTLMLVLNDSSTTAKNINSLIIRTAITTAKAQNKIIRSDVVGTAHVDGDFDFKGIRFIEFYTDLVNTTGTVIVGGFATTADPVDIYFSRITNGNSAINGVIPAVDTFRIEGVKAGVVTVGQTNLLRIHAKGGDVSAGSNAYFELNLTGSVRAFRVSDEGVAGWNNEIRIIGGRIIDLDVTGTGYVPNNLEFDNNVFEGTLVKIRFKNAWTNRITNARMENTASSAGVIFESDSMQNTVICKWNGSGSPRGMFEFPAPVADSGQGNQCVTQNAIEYSEVKLFSVTANSGIIANTTESSASNPFLHKIKGTFVNKQIFTPSLSGFTAQSNRLIALSDLFEVKNGDAVTFDCEFDGNLLRPIIYIYDQNMNLITSGSNHILLAASSFNAASGLYTTTADRGAVILRNGFSVNSSDVKYIQVGAYSSAGGFFRSVRATLFTQKLLRGKTKGMLDHAFNNIQLSALPTKGFVPQGTVINVGANRYVNSQSTTTNVVSAVSASNTIEVLGSSSVVTGIVVGSLVGVMQTDGSTVWTSVTAISGKVLTLADPVTVNAGALVKSNYWQLIGGNSVTFDPPSIDAGASTSTTVTLTGATVGQAVQAAFSQYNADIEITAQVSATNTITVKFKNTSTASVDLASGTLTVKLI